MKAARSRQQTPNTAARKRARKAMMAVIDLSRASLRRALELGFPPEARSHDSAGIGYGKIDDQRRHRRRRNKIVQQAAASQAAIGAPGHANQHHQHEYQPHPKQRAK